MTPSSARTEQPSVHLLPSLITTLATLFVALAVAVAWTGGSLIGDRWIGSHVLSDQASVWWSVADRVSWCASGAVVAVAAAVAAGWLIGVRRRWIQGIAVLAAPAVAGALEIGLKPLIGRPRPLTAALTGESGNGFPSGHVSGFAALAVALLIVVLADRDRSSQARLAWTVAVVASIAATMWSRIALGAHYPSDTVGGALLGSVVALAAVPAVTWTLCRWWRAQQ